MTQSRSRETDKPHDRTAENRPANQVASFTANRMPHGYIIWDSSFRVQGWNAAAEMIFGWSAEEARGKHANDLIVPPDAHQMWEQLMRDDESVTSVNHNVGKNGNQILCEWCNTPLRDAAGKVVGVLSMVHNVTGRKPIEAELSESKKFLQTVIEAQPECIKLIDANGALIMMNRSGLSMIQADSLDQVKGRSIYPLVLPEYRDAFRTITKEVFEGKSGILTFEMMGIKGRRLWLETHAVPLRNVKEEIIALLGITRNVTERKQAEEEILEQRMYAENLVANSSVATFVLNAQHKVVLWNRACEALTGIPAMDVVGIDNHWKAFYGQKRPTLADIIIDGAFEQLPSLYGSFTRSVFVPNGLRAEGWHPNLNGKDRYIIFNAAPVYDSRGELAVVVETLHDVTERKRTEEMLRKQLDFTAAVLETVGSMVLVLDRQGKIVQFNRACEEVSGYTFEEVQGKYVWDFLLPQEQVEAVRGIFKNLVPGMFPNKYENHWVAKDGSRKLIAWSSTALLSSNGSVDFVIPTGIDITERKRTSDALLQEKRFSDAIIDSLPGTFYICDADGRLIRWNDNGKALTGYSIEELMHMNMLDLFREDRDVVAKAMQEVYDAGRATVEARLVTKSGEAIPFFLSGLRVSMDHKQYLVGVGLDISERKQLEDQLRQAQKTESIGTLDRGIICEFNDILTAIVDYGNLLNMKTPIGDPLRHYADQTLSPANSAAQLTQGLHADSRNQVMNPKPVNLNDIVRKLGPFLTRLIGEEVELVMALTDKDVTVKADPGLIEQVLMNLATSARAAMPNGGTLHIHSESIDLDAEFAMTHPCGKPGKYAMVAIADSGAGMDEKTRQRTFDPSLTTEKAGRGLGLAMACDVVKQHKGTIDVMSEVDKGTTVAIYLPAIQADLTEDKSAHVISDKEGRKTILVAEDDEAIRRLAKDMLEEFGYTVILAEDGEDALNKFGENRDKIRLLLLDVIMPKKNGKETYEEIKRMNPDIKAIFLNGHSADLIDKKGIFEEGASVIIKPFAVAALLDKVRLVLGS
ncbi:MAG TPA: PAS domain S-box protein [Nitrospirota bacterium]|nr:PAS domain S-box protein [Nitrospirota bacterium]